MIIHGEAHYVVNVMVHSLPVLTLVALLSAKPSSHVKLQQNKMPVFICNVKRQNVYVTSLFCQEISTSSWLCAYHNTTNCVYTVIKSHMWNVAQPTWHAGVSLGTFSFLSGTSV